LTPRTLRIAPLLFGSGFCALVYQITWEREFRLVFGTSTAASAAVLAVFIGGLGAGGLLLGPRADRWRRPLLLYAHLEMGVAAAAALTPFLLLAVRWAYVAAGGTQVLGLALGTFARLLLAAVVMALPCVLMGGTLPAASAAAENEQDARRRSLALLYAANTLGAVSGALLATFELLERFGTRGTLWLACAVNIAVALIARRLAVRFAPPEEQLRPLSVEEAPRAPRSLVLAAAALVGFAFFLMEIVWYRMLAPILGGTVFTFGLVLGTALLGIGLGGALYALFGSKRPASLVGFALTCLLEAIAVAAPYAAGDRIALLALELRPAGEASLSSFVVGWAVIASLVVLPAAVVAGAQFPLLIALLGQGRRHVGREVGVAYAWNTAGAIGGSLAGGFGLLPWLTAPGCWRWVALLLGGLGVVAAVIGTRSVRWLLLPAAILVAGVSALALWATGPTAAWRHSGIGAGRAVTTERLATPLDVRRWLNVQRRVTAWEAEGVESSLALQHLNEGLAFTVNGKIDGGARGDAPTFVMSGLLGALLRPEARRVLVIGLGTGDSAGWLARVPHIEHVDVVELEPRMVEVAGACAAVNADALTNPKVRILFGDAREVLLTRRERYDLILSMPSNPYRAGVASLFTREFYEAAASGLAEDGLFLQWMQAYEVDRETASTVYATLGSVFPHVETWQLGATDLLLVATRKSLSHDAARLRARLQQQPFADALPWTWRSEGLEGFFSHYLAGDRLTRALANESVAIARDDRNPVEFGFARTVGRRGTFDVAGLQREAGALGDDRPAVRGPVDWERVEDGRLLIFTAVGVPPPRLPDAFTPGQRPRALAQIHYAAGRPQDALRAWRAQEREPSGPVEVALLAEVLADSGDAAAEDYIERLRRFQPAEADAVLARLRVRQGRLDDAAAALESAFERFREDPWPSTAIIQRAIEIAKYLVHRDPRLARRLYEALREPFAVAALEEHRLAAALEAARKLDLRSVCVDALAPFEPDVPWVLELLRYRQECYEATGHPMVGRATRDVADYLRDERRSTAEEQ
jgi:predicted membrane-bound spermidine synthase